MLMSRLSEVHINHNKESLHVVHAAALGSWPIIYGKETRLPVTRQPYSAGLKPRCVKMEVLKRLNTDVQSPIPNSLTGTCPWTGE